MGPVLRHWGLAVLRTDFIRGTSIRQQPFSTADQCAADLAVEAIHTTSLLKPPIPNPGSREPTTVKTSPVALQSVPASCSLKTSYSN